MRLALALCALACAASADDACTGPSETCSNPAAASDGCCGGSATRDAATAAGDAVAQAPGGATDHVATDLVASQRFSEENKELAEAFYRPPELGPEWVRIPGGPFFMGSQGKQYSVPGDAETPPRAAVLSAYLIQRTEVSNLQFAAFIQNTSYVTEAERFGWSFVFEHSLSESTKASITEAVLGAEWWLPVQGATWRDPEGPGTDVFLSKREDHPAVHVSWNDAAAYCDWRLGRLPTEAEWEFAARGGREKKVYPWGNKFQPRGYHRANVFHGEFPHGSTAEDGWHFSAPVEAFDEQNKWGLKNMVGNVWEWVADYWGTYHDPIAQQNPKGPRSGTDKVKKGGSFMCHQSYCFRYRNAARTHATPDSTHSHSGFRCAKDTLPKKTDSKQTRRLANGRPDARRSKVGEAAVVDPNGVPRYEGGPRGYGHQLLP
jgi:sulfatase modifying factor 1